jgi:hypothetical protein
MRPCGVRGCACATHDGGEQPTGSHRSLLDAQNNLIDEQVSYEIARLQLLRDLGILFVDDDGMWK